MSQIEIKNTEGKVLESQDFSSEVFGIEPNVPVMHQVVVCQAASLRQGTHSVKNRSAVSGGGKKPWRQKGTGRARQGTIRAPQWAGGGVVFGPTPRSHARRLNNKEVKLALRSALSAKLRDSELVVLDSYGIDKPSTKAAVKLLASLELAGKRVTVVVPDDDVLTYLSFRNVERASILGVGELTCRDILDNNCLVMSTEVAKKLEEVLA